ncbi:MAG: hypothetical protein QNK11_05600 [Legionella sp.]|nr:hypothetical protein [Legionella sp.]
MPENYNEIKFEIARKNITIAGMAKPGFGKATAAEDIQFLSDNKYTTIISLQPDDIDEQIAKNCVPPIVYIKQAVKDFTPPSIEQFEAIYNRIRTGVSTPGEKVVIHCGEGFGRTGTVLAALKLKELIMATPVEQLLIDEDMTATIDLGQYAKNPGLFACTPMVKKVIESIRSGQGSNKSIEIEKQVLQLHEYQRYLVQQSNNDRYKKDALMIERAYLKSPESFSSDILKNMLDAMYSSEKYTTVAPEVLSEAKTQVVLTGLTFFQDAHLNQLFFDIYEADFLPQDININNIGSIFSLFTEIKNNLQGNTKLTRFYEALNQKLKDIIIDGEALSAVLEPLNDVQRQIILNAVKNDFKKIIEDGLQLGAVLQYLDDVQFRIVLDDLKERIEDAYQLLDTLQSLNDEQCRIVLETVKNDVQGRIIFDEARHILKEIITTEGGIGTVFQSIDEVKLRIIVGVLQDDLKEIMVDGYELAFALKPLNDAQREIVFNAVKNDFKTIIKNAYQLGVALEPLNDTQCRIVLNALSDDFKQIIKDDFSLKLVLDALEGKNELQQAVRDAWNHASKKEKCITLKEKLQEQSGQIIDDTQQDTANKNKF